MEPDLSIIIVNWNTCSLLDDCLDSVFRNADSLKLQIIVVDNNSADGSIKMVEQKFPQVELVCNNVNVGFAVANNYAIPMCKSSLIMLLNSDTVVRKNALSNLITYMHTDSATGAIGPKVVHPETRLRILSCGYQPTLRTVFNHYFGLSSLFPHRYFFRGLHLFQFVHDDRARSVEWISGACILVRRSVIEQVGVLNEEWFMYAEDMEWCDRIMKAGWDLKSVPSAEIEHLMGASTEKNSAVSVMWVTSLMSYFKLRNNASSFEMCLLILTLSIGLGSRAIYYFIRSFLDPQSRAMWLNESRKFRTYAFASLRFS